MIENLQILTTAGTVTAAGVFVPVTDIAGMTTGEITDTGATLEGKLAYGFLNNFFAAITTVLPLGFGESDKSAPAGIEDNIYTEGIETVILRLIDLRTGEIALPPLPFTGNFAGQGKLLLSDCWPNCELVAMGENTDGAGVIIPHSWVGAYGGTIPADVDEDARAWWTALILALAETLPVRTTTVSSGVTFAQNLATNRVTGVPIPATWFAEANSMAQLTAADLPYVRLTQERIRIDYELKANPIAQTFEVNIATS
jgi:hypothetical protein